MGRAQRKPVKVTVPVSSNYILSASGPSGVPDWLRRFARRDLVKHSGIKIELLPLGVVFVSRQDATVALVPLFLVPTHHTDPRMIASYPQPGA